MSRRNQMLTVLKDVDREIVATTTEMVSTVEVLIVHIDTFISRVSVTCTVSVTTVSRLAFVLPACKHRKCRTCHWTCKYHISHSFINSKQEWQNRFSVAADSQPWHCSIKTCSSHSALSPCRPSAAQWGSGMPAGCTAVSAVRCPCCLLAWAC